MLLWRFQWYPLVSYIARLLNCKNSAIKMYRPFFHLMMEPMVPVSNDGTPETHKWVAFLKIYCFIVQYVRLVGKQVKVGGTYILQLSAVDLKLF